jgi:hypothetical protein
MTIGGKLIVAKVIRIYPLDIGVRKNPVKENVVRNRRDGYYRLSPLQRTTRWPATVLILNSRLAKDNLARPLDLQTVAPEAEPRKYQALESSGIPILNAFLPGCALGTLFSKR